MAKPEIKWESSIEMTGVIEKVFSQKDTGWFSAKIKFDDHSTRKKKFREFVTTTSLVNCTGTCDFELSRGMHLSFEVNGVTADPKWGVQFFISDKSIKAICDSATSTWGYLKNLNEEIPGAISELQTRLLFNRYGEKVLDAIRIEDQSEIAQFCRYPLDLKMFVVQNDLLAGILSIHSAITSQVARKAIERYHEESYQKIMENPYILAYELNWDMHKADAVACDVLNLSFGEQRRKDAMLVYAISKLCFDHQGSFIVLNDAHISDIVGIVNQYMLLYRGKAMSPVFAIQNTPETHEWIRRTIDDNENLYLTRVRTHSLVYLRTMYDMETKAAELIRNRTTDPVQSDFDDSDILSLIDEYDTELRLRNAADGGWGLDDDQKEAIFNVFANRVSVINGGAGTGKSTIIDAIIYVGSQLGLENPLMLTPTHKAKKRVLDTLSQQAKDLLAADDVSAHIMTVALFVTLLNMDFTNIVPDGSYVIIDESSMASMWQATKLLQGAEHAKHIVFVGDYHQLPSIDPGCYFLDICKTAGVHRTELMTCHRAKGASIVRNANKINNGDAHIEWVGNEFEFWQSPDDNYANDIANEYVSLIQNGMDIKQICCISPVKALTYKTGVESINQCIQNKLNPLLPAGTILPNISFGEVEWHLNKGHKGYSVWTNYEHTSSIRIGDRVVCEHNYNARVTNGDVGTVMAFTYPDKKNGESDYSARVHIKFDNGMEFEVKPADIGKHFSLAYCVTVHKSQGSEYDTVLLSMPHDTRLSRMLRRELLYTAVTRAKKHVIIYGSWRATERAIYLPSDSRASLLAERIDAKI